MTKQAEIQNGRISKKVKKRKRKNRWMSRI